MKIQAIKSQENKPDILELNGNDLRINGTTFPLDNLPVYPTEENAEILSFLAANQCYAENGVDHLKIYVDNQLWFLFVNNNYFLFHDVDLNGELDTIELSSFINCYNLQEEDRKNLHKSKIKVHEDITGLGSWNELSKEVKKNKDKIEDKIK